MYVVKVPSTSRRRERLDREQIVRAAIAYADADGVGALSMRNLAERMGCAAMSLYNHVANKNELLLHMVDAVAAEVAEPPADIAPLAAVRAFAIATRAVFVDHRWAPALWLAHLPGPARARHMEVLLEAFGRSGLSPAVAHLGFHAVNNHVIGYSLQEVGLTVGGDDPAATIQAFLASVDDGHHDHLVAHVHQHLDGDTDKSFEPVLDLILDGLVRLDAGQAGGAGR